MADGAERGEVVKGAEEAIGADWDMRAEGAEGYEGAEGLRGLRAVKLLRGLLYI